MFLRDCKYIKYTCGVMSQSFKLSGEFQSAQARLEEDTKCGVVTKPPLILQHWLLCLHDILGREIIFFPGWGVLPPHLPPKRLFCVTPINITITPWAPVFICRVRMNQYEPQTKPCHCDLTTDFHDLPVSPTSSLTFLHASSFTVRLGVKTCYQNSSVCPHDDDYPPLHHPS